MALTCQGKSATIHHNNNNSNNVAKYSNTSTTATTKTNNNIVEKQTLYGIDPSNVFWFLLFSKGDAGTVCLCLCRTVCLRLTNEGRQMSQITRKSNKINHKLKTIEKMATKTTTNSRRSRKRARLNADETVTSTLIVNDGVSIAPTTTTISTTAKTATAETTIATEKTAASTALTKTTTRSDAIKNQIQSFANSDEVQIKKECPEEGETVETIDVKPDLNDLNRDLLNDASTMVLPQSVLPTLFILSQLPPGNCVANSFAAATTTTTNRILPATTTTHHGLAAAFAATHMPSSIGVATHNYNNNISSINSCISGSISNNNNNNNTITSSNDSAACAFPLDEFDLQESDSDEDGYSDIDFDDDDELIEDDDEVDFYDPVWTDQPTEPRMVCNFSTLSQNVGLHGRPTCLETSFYVGKILNSEQEFFERVAASTNVRAQLQMGANTGSGQLFINDISIDEMKIFIGICLHMSGMKLRTLADYWNENAVWGFKGFGHKMDLKRFQTILNALSFDFLMDPLWSNIATGTTTTASIGEEMTSTTDPAFNTIQPLVDFFNRRMDEIYNSGQRLVLNDPILFWKGRFNWFSDMKSKFRCNSIMVNLLTEYTGLIQRVVLDVERDERRNNVRNSKLLVAQRVVVAKQLLSTRLGRGHTVYASKFYGSYALAHELSRHQTYCTGFVDVKRYGNCKELILTKLEPKTFATKYAGCIMMGKWRNRQKSEYFFSSDCLAIYAKETSAHAVDRRPKIIRELNWQLNWKRNWKLSEEMKEKMLCYQLSLERKEIKWDKQLAIYIINLMIFNAYVLYIMHAQLGRTRFTELILRDTTILKSYSTFRQDFIQTLLSDDEKVNAANEEEERQEGGVASSGEMKKKKKLNRSSTAEDSEEDDVSDGQHKNKKKAMQKILLDVDHTPVIIPRRKGKFMKKKCRICRKAGMLTFSKFCCQICPGMPGLCETPCFKLWHEQLKKSLEAGESIKSRIFGTIGRESIYF